MMKDKKSHGVQLLIRAVVKDPDGKVLSDTGQKPSKSYLIQFLEALYGLFRGTNVNATATDGTEDIIFRGSISCAANLRTNAAINIDTYGPVVGTGDTPEDNTDHKLDAQLTEGVGVGNITHGATLIETTAVVGANVDLEIKRSFPNNTGSTITVKEAGVYVTGYGGEHCIIRDVLPAPVVVPDMCSLTVYYTLRTTV